MTKAKKMFHKNLISAILVICLIITGSVSAIWSNNVYSHRLEQNVEDTVESLHINTLLLGVDKEGYRTDVVIFAQLDMVNGTLNMLQIPRDTYVKDGKNDKKMNSSYFVYKDGKMQKDIDNVYREVESVTGLRASNYMLVDTAGFRNIIDAMGGVEFDVPIRMLYEDPEQDLYIDLNKGKQILNGDRAEQLVRFRQNTDGTGYARGDIERIELQREFIYAVLDKAFSAGSMVKLPEIISIFNSSCETSFSQSDMLQYAPFVMGLDREHINIMTLEGVAEYIGRISYYIPNQTLNKNIVDTYFSTEQSADSLVEFTRREKLLKEDENSIVLTPDYNEQSGFFARFVSDITLINGSNGKTDSSAIADGLSKQGLTVNKIIETGNVTYSKSMLVSDFESKVSNDIANALGFEVYEVNSAKTNGATHIIVIGEDY